MPKVTGPLLSSTATGTVGKTLTYCNRNGTNVVKGSYLKKTFHPWFKRVVPVSSSISQLASRCVFKNATDVWKSLPAFVKEEWNVLALGQKMSGYNYFISEYIKNGFDLYAYQVAYLFGMSYHILTELIKLKCTKILLFSIANDDSN